VRVGPGPADAGRRSLISSETTRIIPYNSLSLLRKSGLTLSLKANDVARIAELARLELSDAESARMLDQLNSVLGLIESLQAVDTTGVVPMTHAGDLSLRLRPDEVTEPDRREAYQRVAPAVDHGLYLVPRVIE
jgi:aspartyl-tRNA(Asn)/glutamyl-tRNA(Gln) amidotransferase subunit C